MVIKMNNNILFHQQGLDTYYNIWHTTGRNMILYMYTDGGSIVGTEKTYPIKQGGLCFIGSNKFHYTLPEDPQAYDRSKVFLSDEGLQAVLSLFPRELNLHEIFHETQLVYTQLEPQEQTAVEQIFHLIHSNADDTRYGDTVLKSSFAQLLIYLHRGRSQVVSAPWDIIQNAVEYINSHIAEDITIDDICQHIHISKYHFCRKFKQTTGFTVMDYVLKTRIAAAQNLLSGESLSVSDAAQKCGFSSSSYFCRIFKAHTGLSPLQYRKSNGSQKST